MDERFTNDIDITEADIIRNALEIADGFEIRDNEVTTVMVSEMLDVSRRRAYDILQGLVAQGHLTRRAIKTNSGGKPFAYAPVGSWKEVLEALKEESQDASEDMG